MEKERERENATVFDFSWRGCETTVDQCLQLIIVFVFSFWFFCFEDKQNRHQVLVF